MYVTFSSRGLSLGLNPLDCTIPAEVLNQPSTRSLPFPDPPVLRIEAIPARCAGNAGKPAKTDQMRKSSLAAFASDPIRAVLDIRLDCEELMKIGFVWSVRDGRWRDFGAETLPAPVKNA